MLFGIMFNNKIYVSNYDKYTNYASFCCKK